MEMVEKVARAISEAIKFQDSLAHYPYEDRKEEMDDVARAALEAMREPTEAMLENGAAMDDISGHPLDIWQAMIAAAREGAQE